MKKSYLEESILLEDYNFLKKNAVSFFEEKEYNTSLKLIEYCAKIGYGFLFESRLNDSDLEQIIIQIALNELKFGEYSGNPKRIVLCDSFALDNRGLTQQYLNALIHLEYEILYVVTSDLYFNNGSDIINSIKKYAKGEYIIVKESTDYLEKARFLLETIDKFQPSKIFFHPSPWDITSILIGNSITRQCHKYFINITDDHYWLGASIIDTIIEFRNFGYQFTKYCRNIPGYKITLLPYYPIIQDESAFEGLSIDTHNKVVAVSGGNGYKFLGMKNAYVELVSNLLTKNDNLILLLVGAGVGGRVVKSLCHKKIQDRIHIMPSRKDIFQLVKRCDIYIASIPRAGGLMTQIAIKAGLPILNYAHKNMKTSHVKEVSPFHDLKVLDIEEKDDFIKVANRLIKDKKYRVEYASFTNDTLLCNEQFESGLEKIISGNEPFIENIIDNKHVQDDLEYYQKLAFEVENDYLRSYPSTRRKYSIEFKKKFGKNLFRDDKLFKEKRNTSNFLLRIKGAIKRRIKSSIRRFVIEKQINFNEVKFNKIGGGTKVSGSFIIKNPKYIKIGEHFSSLYNLRIEAWDNYADQRYLPEIIIGDNVSFNTDVHIGCINNVVIGDNVLFASRIYISDHSHGEITKQELDIPPSKRRLVSKGPVLIEDNVWIGEGVCILPNVTIGKNSIVGANSVVTKSFPPFSIIAGNPARMIKNLD